MNQDIQFPDELELNKPNIARIYDCLLGGYHNFEIDRLAAQAVLKVLPNSRLSARQPGVPAPGGQFPLRAGH